MTKKRFTIKEFSTLDAMSSLDVICDKGIELPSSTACDLLNELNYENEQLKNKLKFFNELNKPYGTIIKENEQLKQQNKINEDCYKELLQKYDDLNKKEKYVYFKMDKV